MEALARLVIRRRRFVIVGQATPHVSIEPTAERDISGDDRPEGEKVLTGV